MQFNQLFILKGGKEIETISVVVPVHDPTGSQRKRIIRLAHSIAAQDYPITQVVMTSRSALTYQGQVAKVLESVERFDFHIVDSRSAAENLNLAMAAASEGIVKILFQDDFLLGFDYVSKLVSTFSKSQSPWLVSRSVSYLENKSSFVRDLKPKYSESLRNGKNSIGPPSCVALRKQAVLPFSEDLIYMFDCEWYLKMAHTFGPPLVAKDIAVAVALHADQLTHSASQHLATDRILTRSRHPGLGPFLKSCPCTSHRSAGNESPIYL
jgi:hypothetical protein